jgi:hypothetical protein
VSSVEAEFAVISVGPRLLQLAQGYLRIPDERRRKLVQDYLRLVDKAELTCDCEDEAAQTQKMVFRSHERQRIRERGAEAVVTHASSSMTSPSTARC